MSETITPLQSDRVGKLVQHLSQFVKTIFLLKEARAFVDTSGVTQFPDETPFDGGLDYVTVGQLKRYLTAIDALDAAFMSPVILKAKQGGDVLTNIVPFLEILAMVRS